MTEGSVKVSEFGMATHASPWMSYMDIKAWLIFRFVQIFPTGNTLVTSGSLK